jgi:hypothetical protein
VTLIKHIEEELVLVDFLVKWTMIYLKDPEDPELMRIIRVLLGISKEYDNYIVLNIRQRCLLKQFCQGFIKEISLPSYTRKIKYYMRYISENIKVDCSYYTDEGNIYCNHETFHYYTIYKWFGVYCKYFNEYFPNKECIFNNIIKEEIDLLYPKKSYCESCYIQYKNNNLDRKIVGNGIDDKYILYNNKESTAFYRMKFSDNCDIESSYGHFKEFKTNKDKSKDILESIVSILKVEIEKYRSFSKQIKL